MSPTKLTEADKQEIVRLYQDSPETTSTLAERFHVSNSTIGRLLKGAFSSEEYNLLVRQKRLKRGAAAISTPTPSPTESDVAESTDKPIAPPKVAPPEVNDANDTTVAAESIAAPSVNAVPAGEATSNEPHSWLDDAASSASSDDDDFTAPPESVWGEDYASLDEDDWDDEDDEDEGAAPADADIHEEEELEILPLSVANFPRTCYLVVDRAGELIVKPLVEFRDLGRLPDEEFQQKTLVVFENHKVARRYSNNRTQRIIKIPDGRLLYKTSTHLQSKGITRILMDGRIYALVAENEAAVSVHS